MMLEGMSIAVAKSHYRLCQCQGHTVSEDLLEILIGVIDVMICMYQATRPKGTSDEQKRERNCSVLSMEKTKEKIGSSNWQSLGIWWLHEVVSYQIQRRASKRRT